MTKQNGNTFLGFMIGLLLSLSICALVALKWGEVPSQLASTVLEKTHLAGSGMPVIPTSTFGKNGLNLAAPATTHPTPELNHDLATPPANPLSSQSGEGSVPTNNLRKYRLQAGSYKTPDQAEATKAQLALIGVESSVIRHPGGEGAMFRVIAGPFDEVVMKSIRGKIQESGISVIAVRASN